MKRPDFLHEWFTRSSREVSPGHHVGYWTKSENCPDVIANAIYEAHDGTVPNDWVYEQCADAVEAMDDAGGYDEDDAHQFADDSVDVYTSKLFTWAAEFCNSSLFAEAQESANECDAGGEIADRIARIQYFAAERIYHVMGAAYAEATTEA